MTDKTAIKKPRKANTSKAAMIRKLFAQGKLTPKQIGEKVGAPMPYVYVVRSKMKAEAGGLPAVAEKKIPVFGGIQEVASEAEARDANKQKFAEALVEETLRHHPEFLTKPPFAPARFTLTQPTFFERVKERIRAWLS